MNNKKRKEIERAVEFFGGKLPDNNSLIPDGHHRCILRVTSPSHNHEVGDFTIGSTAHAKSVRNFVCYPDAFEKVAREMGYINGFKWGVEYPTNGKKPDLPGDIAVQFKSKEGDWCAKVAFHDVIELSWKSRVAWRIIDPNYKPKSKIAPPTHENHRCVQVVIEGNWHERGELPPVGEVCEIQLEKQAGGWEWVECQVRGYFESWVWIFNSEITDITMPIDSVFRPTQPHRDKVIEAAFQIIYKADDYRTGAEKLYDAGMLKMPEGDQ